MLDVLPTMLAGHRIDRRGAAVLLELHAIGADVDRAALRADILDSQQKNQPYREFTRRAMAAGVQGYFAFLRGKRVTYWGRGGDQHTEWFPGTSPSEP